MCHARDVDLGPYRDVVLVGRGGMGTVFRGRAPGGSDVAIKLLSRLDPPARDRFERERRLLAALGEAEGFVPVLDAGDSQAGPYIVMPFVPGGTLRSRLVHGPLGADETLRLGQALASALGRAHERGIVHRDLKPENVLFTRGGRPLVADLGLAKHFDRSGSGGSQSVSLSQHGEIRGTAGYMSPEQLEDARSASPPADVFALGAILYECLAGRPAFEAPTVLELLSKTAAASTIPLSVAAPATPPWLAGVVERALARVPAERFRDGAALGQALARSKTSHDRTSSAARRRSWLLVAGLVATTGLAALGLRGSAPRFPLTPVKPPPVPREPTAVELVGAAGQALERRADADAIRDATRAIERDPELSSAWTIRAAARVKARDWDEAVKDATRAIELDPRLGRAWAERGAALEGKSDHDRAFADLDRAIELDPGYGAAWGSRGLARLMGRTDVPGGMADLTRAIELDPGLGWAWMERGTLRAKLGDVEAGISDLTRAAELGEPEGYMNRGTVRSMRGDHAGALDDFTRTIALDPKSANAWANRGGERENTGDHAGALEDLKHALELDSKEPNTWRSCGNVYRNLGDAARAVPYYKRFIELAGPDDPRAQEIQSWLARNEAP